MISFFGAPAAAVVVVLAHPVTRVMAATAQRTLVRVVNIFFIRFVVMVLSVVEKRYEFSGVAYWTKVPLVVLILTRFETDRATSRYCAAKADRTPARNSSAHSGLMKKAAAPAANAFQRTARSSFALRTMTLVKGETSLSRLWTSKPCIRGIHISITAT